MNKVYLALGANLGEPRRQLQDAVFSLHAHPAIQLQQCSSMYASKPMGPQNQPDYVNAVIAIQTSLTPHQLLDATQAIETAAGRVRGQHWGPRTLDIDILLFDSQIVTDERLLIPHPGLTQREFVLIPLAEIAPELILADGQTVTTLARQIPANGLDIIAPPVTMQG